MGGWRRAVAMVVAGVLVGSGLVAVRGDRAAPAQVSWLDLFRNPPAAASVGAPLPELAPVPLARTVPTAADTATFPTPGDQVVTLDAGRVRAGALSLWQAGDLSPRAPQAADARQVRLEVLDRAAAARAGVTGFVFRLTGAAGSARPPVTLSADYSGFAHAFGGGYADRLRLVALPDCVLAEPRPAGCRADATVLPSRHDAGATTLTADLGPAGGASLFAVTGGVSGDTGTFAASPLSPSGDWQVAPGSGEFSWTYDVTVPEPPAGLAPEVALSYSSGAIDGMISTRNTQGPRTGVGWGEFASSFVERRYTSCQDTVGTGDLCWKSHNATISLNGESSEMVPTDSTRNTWRLKDDPGWVVEHLHLTNGSNGDENGEYWKVTTPDGVQYFFGLGSNPDTQAATNSTWTVPVLADHSGEPCRAPGDVVGACEQAWRWNLDRVVDPNQMTTTYYYFKSFNRYRAINGLGNPAHLYVKGGRLDRIEYGKPAGTDGTVFPAAKITFGGEYRCVNLNDSCPVPTSSNASLFPDVPTDLVCSANCLVTTPTFFATDRYAWVRSEVRVGGAWRPVEQVNLIHGFWANSDGDRKLYLNGIQRVGLAQQSLLPLPTVIFWPEALPNRVDGTKRMEHIRVKGIIDEYGHQTWVTYGKKSTCPASKVGPSVRWDLNTQDCFPQKVRDTWATFHKYLTMKVEELDPTGGSPPMVTNYTYEGTPAWHHDDDEFSANADQSWSDWRGYGTTTITQGATKTRVRLFRGMHGDKMQVGGPRSVQVEPFDGAGFDAVPAIDDMPWLAGGTLVEAKLGPAGEVLEATLHENETRISTQGSADPQDWATWTGESAVTVNVARTGGFAQQRSRTTYTSFFQPETVLEEGWLDQTGDERCTRTTYATNAAAGLYAFPAGEVALAGDCASTVELSHSQSFYDGSTTLGAPPTRGDLTRQSVKVDGTRFVTTVDTAYDAFGRVTRSTDAAGQITETSYAATLAGGYPPSTVETVRVGAASHVTTTEWLPEFDVPLKVTDPNGNLTSYAYDGLGRLIAVRLPTEQATGKPRSYEFTYRVSPDRSAPPMVKTARLVSHQTAAFEESWVVYDTALRERQSQARSPEGGKVLVATTVYDDRGLVAEEIPAQAVTGTLGTGLLTATWDNRTRTGYDALSREIRQAWFRGGIEQWAAVTSYTHDTTTVERPDGRKARSQTDGLGRLIRAEEWDGAGWAATVYGYDLADRLLSVTDPAGNTIGYTYNLAGWRLTMDDPDAGLWRYGYDDAGREVSVTDARGGITTTAYDQLSRPVERRSGSTALASWAYDAPGEKGMLDRSTRFAPSGAWVTDVAGYDSRGRITATTLTVPAGVPGLSGSYTTSYGYDAADRVTTTGYPAVGGLPAETVTTRYNAIGLADQMTGIDQYVATFGYDNRARPKLASFGPRPGGVTWLAKLWTYDGDQRLTRVETALDGVATGDHQYGYDALGTLLSRTTVLGSQSWRECYGRDTRMRLTSAYTTSAAACDGTLKGTGSQPYDHTYSYTPDGNLKTRVEGGVTRTYSYPAAGADRPHAPTAVGPDSYAWDNNGNLASRTVAGVANTFAWDAERRLASVTGPQGTDSYTYDADGTRLLRATAQGRTLYLPGQEVTANVSGSTVSGTRTYSFAGATVAARTPTGLSYLLDDQQGSIEASVPAGGTSLQVSRAYTPYGQRRSGGELPTDRGWLGEIEDDTTRLSYLNARYYDPNLGRFISPDPLLDQSEPQTVNPYAYGLNNPVDNSDPDGLKAKSMLKMIIKMAIAAAARAAARIVRAVAAAARVIARSAANAARAAAKAAAKAAAMRKALAKRAALEKAHRAAKLKAAKERKAMLALRKANPNPAFWKWVAKVGPKAAVKTAKRIEHEKKTRRANDIAALVNGTLAGIRAAGDSDDDDDGGDGGCGLSWSGLGNCLQGAGHVVRFTTNLPRTTLGVGWAYLNGGSCRMRHGMMVACTDMDWGYGFRGGFTFGNAYFTDADEVSDERMRHEAAHATQWAILGDATPVFYFADWAIAWGNPCRQVMEIWAGTEGGGYHQC